MVRRRSRQLAGRAAVTREDWVNTALEELGRGGPDQVGIDHLAQRLSRTKGSFYNHFDDRDDLLLAMGEAILVSDDLRRSTHVASNPSEAVRLLGRLFDYAYSATEQQHAFFHLTHLSSPSDLVKVVAEIRRRRIEVYEQLLRTAGLDPSVARYRAVLMHNAFVGHHSLIETNPDYRSVPEYIVALKHLLIPVRVDDHSEPVGA